MSDLIFCDTETTGLSLSDDIWEFAALRRYADGREPELLHLFIEHDPNLCKQLPDEFRADHAARFPSPCSGRITTQARAAALIANFTDAKLGDGRPHLVGAVPNFDAERLTLLLDSHHRQPGWHYHLIDVENLAVGYLYGRYGTRGGRPVEAEGDAVDLPWDSDELSLAVGVDPSKFPRHTAEGDLRWAMAIYDAVTGPRDA